MLMRKSCFREHDTKHNVIPVRRLADYRESNLCMNKKGIILTFSIFLDSGSVLRLAGMT